MSYIVFPWQHFQDMIGLEDARGGHEYFQPISNPSCEKVVMYFAKTYRARLTLLAPLHGHGLNCRLVSRLDLRPNGSDSFCHDQSGQRTVNHFHSATGPAVARHASGRTKILFAIHFNRFLEVTGDTGDKQLRWLRCFDCNWGGKFGKFENFATFAGLGDTRRGQPAVAKSL